VDVFLITSQLVHSRGILVACKNAVGVYIAYCAKIYIACFSACDGIFNHPIQEYAIKIEISNKR